jgi:exosortase A
MTVQTMAPSARGELQQHFRLAGPVLGVGLLLFAILFHAEIAAAVEVWIDSTAYNHCFLVIPIVAYLIWDRRDALTHATPIPNAWFALAAIPVIMVWLLAERLGIMEGRQLMVMTLVEIFFLCVLGWRLYYRLLGPLLYLYFLVPFGEFLVPSLQGFTTSFIVHGLNLMNIPNYADGFAIEIPEGAFQVAEACAGLRFLIASIAFGCLYALLMYRSPLRRAAFILISLVVPIIANGFRALGIVVLGHILGNAQAAVADHLIYGWLFFSVVILLQIALGLPFRQDHTTPADAVAAPPRPRAAGVPSSVRPDARSARGIRRRSMPWHQKALTTLNRSWAAWREKIAVPPSRPATLAGLGVAAAAAVVIAAIGPAAALVLNSGSGNDLPSTLQPITFTGACTSDPARPVEKTEKVGRIWTEHLKCGAVGFTLRLEVFPPRTTPNHIIAELRTLAGDPSAEISTVAYLSTPEGPRTWRIVDTEKPSTTSASSLWIDGKPAQMTFDMRVHRAWASVFGGNYAPVAITLTPELDWSKPNVALHNRAHDLISLFVQTYQSLPDQITRLSYMAAR